MSTPLRAAAAAALLLTLAAAPAAAKDLTLTDEAGDVWTQKVGSTSWVTTSAAEAAEADVRKVLVRHGSTTVVVRAKITDITKSGTGHSLVASFTTNEKVRRTVVLYTTAANRAGRVAMYKGSAKVCKDKVKRTVDYAKDTMTVRFPRGCLSAPRWLRARVENGWGSDNDVAAYVDNPHNAQAGFTGWSARVYRG